MGLKVSGIARLTRDPESRQAGSTSVCQLGLVSSQRIKTKAGEKKEKSTFFDVDAWGQQGQVVQNYFKKGDRIYVEAELEQDSWEDKDGNKRSKLKGRLVSFEFIEKPTSAEKAEPEDNSEKGEDVPF